MKYYPKWTAVLRRLLLAVAIAATLVAAVVVEEDWRGERAWQRLVRDYAARGEPLDFDAYLPPPVPDDQNLFKTPVLARFLNINDPQSKVFNEYSHKNQFLWDLVVRGLGNWQKGQATDFVLAYRQLKKSNTNTTGVNEKTAAGAVLAALDGMKPELDELCIAARTRPQAQMTLSADRSITNPSAVLRLFEPALTLRACARLELGQSDKAFDDLYAALRLAEGPFAHPSSAGILVGGISAKMAIQPFWEGCAKGAWNEYQLEQIQALASRFHPLADLAPAIRAGRAATAGYSNTWLQRPRWMIHGWWQLNKVTYCEFIEAADLTGFDPAASRVFLDKIDRANALFRRQHESWSPFTWLIRHTGHSSIIYVASCEHQFILVQTVCALERYRLHYGHYPETFAELVPSWITEMPHDVIDGRPLRYQRTADGRYKLYSIGQNGADDHGTPPTPTRGHYQWTPSKDGDWPWIWPAVK
jgi:hypothetical protein